MLASRWVERPGQRERESHDTIYFVSIYRWLVLVPLPLGGQYNTSFNTMQNKTIIVSFQYDSFIPAAHNFPLPLSLAPLDALHGTAPHRTAPHRAPPHHPQGEGEGAEVVRGYSLKTDGTYAYARAYLEELARLSGYEIVILKRHSTMVQRGEAAPGYMGVFRKPD